jgi:hypothetical protein
LKPARVVLHASEAADVPLSILGRDSLHAYLRKAYGEDLISQANLTAGYNWQRGEFAIHLQHRQVVLIVHFDNLCRQPALFRLDRNITTPFDYVMVG